MLKQFSCMVILCLCLFPLPVLASSIPQNVKESVQTSLQSQIDSVNLLTEGTISSDSSTELGEGYPVYLINTMNQVSNNTYAKKTSLDQSLQFDGYVFVIKSDRGSKAIGFASQAPSYNEIVHFSTDRDFEQQINKAKIMIGYNQQSKVIYDGANQVVAYVSEQDGVQQVVLLKESMLNHMTAFEVLNSDDFITQVISSQQQRSQPKYTSGEFAYSGGASTSSEIPERYSWLKYFSVFVFILLLGAMMLYLIRKK